MGIFSVTTTMIAQEKKVNFGKIEFSVRGITSRAGRANKACLTILYDRLPVLVVTYPLKSFRTQADLVYDVLGAEEELMTAAVQAMGASGLRTMIYQAIDGKGPVTVTITGPDPPSIVNELNEN